MKQEVLMVDDSQFEADILSHALSKVSDSVKLVLQQDAEAALGRLEAGERPHLLLLDLRMPLIDGFQFMEQIQARSIPDLPIVVLTSSTDDDDRRRSLDAGATDFRTKPASLDGYRELARYIVERIATPQI
ncbi:MAG: response regulator [Novosphingobium sp.]|nr:response regulator [Novosphingobium sp.]